MFTLLQDNALIAQRSEKLMPLKAIKNASMADFSTSACDTGPATTFTAQSSSVKEHDSLSSTSNPDMQSPRPKILFENDVIEMEQ